MSQPHWRWKRKDGVKGYDDVLKGEEAAQPAVAADRLRRGYVRRVLPELAAADARSVGLHKEMEKQ